MNRSRAMARPDGSAGLCATTVSGQSRSLCVRMGVLKSTRVTPIKAVAIPIELQSEASLNAFTSDDGIVVYSSMLRLAKTDAQLALIIGHELAHANLGHLDKRRINTVLGWAGGAAIDAGILFGGISTGGAFNK